MSLNFFKRFIRIFRNRQPINPYQRLIEKGHLEVGHDSKIDNSKFEILHSKTDCLNVIIGNNCNIMGTMSIYSPNAKIVIGDRVFIGPQTKLICFDQITIEDDVMISWDCTVMDTNSHSLVSDERSNDVLDWNKGWQHKDWNKVKFEKILIGKKSWIGFKSIILKGVSLGVGTVVASGSVVTKSFVDFSVIGGNPAKFIKKTT